MPRPSSWKLPLFSGLGTLCAMPGVRNLPHFGLHSTTASRSSSTCVVVKVAAVVGQHQGKAGCRPSHRAAAAIVWQRFAVETSKQGERPTTNRQSPRDGPSPAFDFLDSGKPSDGRGFRIKAFIMQEEAPPKIVSGHVWKVTKPNLAAAPWLGSTKAERCRPAKGQEQCQSYRPQCSPAQVQTREGKQRVKANPETSYRRSQATPDGPAGQPGLPDHQNDEPTTYTMPRSPASMWW